MFELWGFFAGIWPLVQGNLAAVFGVAGGLLFWRFSPAGKDIGLIVAIVAALGLVAFNLGVHDGESHVKAESAVVVQHAVTAAGQARASAEKSIAASPVKPAAGGVRHNGKSVRTDKFDRG